MEPTVAAPQTDNTACSSSANSATVWRPAAPTIHYVFGGGVRITSERAQRAHVVRRQLQVKKKNKKKKHSSGDRWPGEGGRENCCNLEQSNLEQRNRRSI